MARTKSSKRWLKEHFSDKYVKQSQADGYRSRACYKLIEIDDKYRLLKPGVRLLDLGSAPGGWTQVACERVGSNGFILASDILPMDALPEVTFIQGDFSDDKVFDRLLYEIGDKGLDLVLSDMAPNLSGVKNIDQPRSMLLVELAFDIACRTLKPGGAFLTKVFHGEGFDQFVRDCRGKFGQVNTVKPAASRSRSSETYLLARDFVGSDG